MAFYFGGLVSANLRSLLPLSHARTHAILVAVTELWCFTHGEVPPACAIELMPSGANDIALIWRALFAARRLKLTSMQLVGSQSEELCCCCFLSSQVHQHQKPRGSCFLAQLTTTANCVSTAVTAAAVTASLMVMLAGLGDLIVSIPIQNASGKKVSSACCVPSFRMPAGCQGT